jgi:hypothetical protein
MLCGQISSLTTGKISPCSRRILRFATKFFFEDIAWLSICCMLKPLSPPFSNFNHVIHDPSSGLTSGQINPEDLMMSIGLTRPLFDVAESLEAFESLLLITTGLRMTATSDLSPDSFIECKKYSSGMFESILKKSLKASNMYLLVYKVSPSHCCSWVATSKGDGELSQTTRLLSALLDDEQLRADSSKI